MSSVTSSGGILSTRVEIMSIGSRYDITDVKKDAAQDAVVAINTLRKTARKSNGSTAVQQASGMEEIKKAKELLDAGVISKEEFEKIKAKYL